MSEFEYVDVDPVTAILMTATVSHNELGATIGRLFGELGAANPEAEMVGPPMVVYTAWRPNDCDIEVALPVEQGTSPRSGTILKTYPSCTALRTTYTGSYEGLSDAWMGLWKYVEDNGVQAGMPCWDSYIVGPTTEQNPSNWVTELYVPLEKIG